MTLFIHLMGTVRLIRDGQSVDVGGPKQQTVLAVLALSAGHRVSTDRLVDLLWDENPPVSARRTVQSYVSSVRRLLGGGSVLESSQNGYTLNLDRGVVDLLAFEDEAADVLAYEVLEPDDRAERLAKILSVWETPLDGLRDASRLGDLMAPFEELRFQAIEGLAAAQIAGTRAGAAVKMLEGLVREYPTRENLWHELARGLNHLGRRDAALNAVQRAREALREHLGVNPSALLSALETDLLSDDVAPLAGSIGTDSAGPAKSALVPGNLPKALSSFIGRADEIDEVARLLSRERLVTLRGLGGIGKTSLALEVAAGRHTEFGDGVWFIDLAYVAPAATMTERFLAALGLTSRPEVAPLDQLITELGPLRALLVIDNCEQQIAEIAELVTQLVHIAPNLHFLATSRASLAVAGEAVWQVESLDISAAVELFADRASLVRHGSRLSDSNREVVELICEKLDGIPLAIELAAARLNVLSLDQILVHLDDRFGLLRGQAPAQRPEERTLQSALDWSFGLLDEHDRNLLKRLAVFPAGFTLEAAQNICAADQSPVSLVNSMALLVEASLVVFDANDTYPRYRLLETVREYVAEMLGTPAREETALQHASFYADVASQIAAQHLTDHVGAMEAVDRDLDNFRAAMAYAFEHQQPERGLSVARHLRVYYLYRMLNRELLRWLQIGLEQVDPDSDEGLFAIANALIVADNAGDVDVAERLAERVESSMDRAQNPVVRARLLSSHGAHLTDSDPRAAAHLLATATALVKDIDTHLTVACIHNWAMTAWRTGDLPDADAMIATLDAQPDGVFIRRERVLVEAQAAACSAQWEEVVAASVEHHGLDEEASETLLHLRAEALGALGRIDEAIATLDRLIELEPFEDRARSNQQIIRATTELRRGDAATAKSLLAESAAAFTRESERVQGLWLGSLAGVAAHELGDDDTAALLFGYARAIGDEFDILMRMSERPLIDHASQQCRRRLGSDRFDEIANRGASSNWVDLVELLQAT